MTLKRGGGKPNAASDMDAQLLHERAALGSLIEKPALLHDAGLRVDDFILSDHQKIYAAMCRLQSFDIVTLSAALNGRVDASYIGGLVCAGYIPENFAKYVSGIREGARDRQFRALQEQLANARNGDRAPIVDEMLRLLQHGDDQWREIFHTYTDFVNAQPLSFAISGFLPCDGITLIGGLASHSKTLTMLSMNRSLLTGEPLFGWAPFSVSEPARRVLYLIPESSIGPFWSRLQMFHLEEFLRDDRLLVRTLSHREQQVDLSDPRILRAAAGSDVFLDTATRFMSGGEDAENTRVFANTLFQLLAAGARTVVGAHHAPKSFEGDKHITLENILRGSGDLGAMLSAGWGLRQVDSERNAVFVANIKARDFEPIPPFVIEGRPSLDERGSFAMIEPPGRAQALREYLEEKKEKSGRPSMPNKTEKMRQALELREAGRTYEQIAEALGISRASVGRMFFDWDRQKDTVQ